MLDGKTYRFSQSLARRQISNWHIAQFHQVAFSHDSFPQNISSISDLGQLIDSMQEGRFETYMMELCGLTNEDRMILVGALADLVVFQKTYMPDVPARVAYSTVISAMALYYKIKALAPSCRTILEIGPGCGYLPLFLKSHPGLETYAQIEACEAYYLLQNAVNTFCFPARVDERAYPAAPELAQKTYTRDATLIEPMDAVDIPASPKCVHYPWWRLGEIVERPDTYDVITSNANLKEFAPTALLDYLNVIHTALKPEGIVIAQCLGGEFQTRDEILRQRLYESGFAPLIYFETGGVKELIDPRTGRKGARVLTVAQGVFVKEGHPLFERHYARRNYETDFVSDDPAILDVMLEPPGRRIAYRRGELLEMVKAELRKKFS